MLEELPLLNRDQILGSNDTKFEEVPCPEWGGKVRVRSATAIERDEYDQSLTITKRDKDGKAEVVDNLGNAKARLVVKCVIDDKGNRMFKDDDAGDLGMKNAAVVDRLHRRVAHLSGMTRASVEEIEKNFGKTRQGDSAST